jgi:hypothetical protein
MRQYQLLQSEWRFIYGILMRNPELFMRLTRQVGDQNGGLDPQASQEFLALISRAINRRILLLNHLAVQAGQLNQFESRASTPNEGVPQHVLDAIPLTKPSAKDEESSCSICLEIIDQEAMTMQLPCLHQFHPACIRKWLLMHNKCPNCKGKVHNV